MIRIIVIAILISTLTACSRLQQLTCSSHDNPTIASLMKQACSGDKHVQFTLGDMFERGDGVVQDEKRARAYYEQAATPTSGTSYIYVPGAGSVAGFTMPVTTGTSHPGHAEAMRRLANMLMDGRGGKQDTKRAQTLVGRADALGGRQAHQYLN